MKEKDLYLSGKSIPEISRELDIPLSTIRFRLKKIGVLRSREEAIKLCAKEGRLGSGNRGKKRKFTEDWKKNISKGKKGKGKGLSKKISGYVVITMGENKGRLEHTVVMEKSIGRKLFANECIHHINKVKSDNRLENLRLMTKKDHALLHAKENHIKRKRCEKGRFL